MFRIPTILSIGFLIFGSVATFAIERFLQNRKAQEYVRAIRNEDPRYSLINPLLICDVSERKGSEIISLEKDMEKLRADFLSRGVAERISVYFRELPTGKWAGIDQNAEYDPASLYKVPVLIAYLKRAETNPDILSEKLQFTGGEKREGGVQSEKGIYNFQPSALEAKKTYTVEDLLRAMIVKSDNDAADLLIAHASLKSFEEVFFDLGISSRRGDNTYGVSAKNYSFFFRLLYNSTYLGKDASERALKLLQESEFKDGLVRGVGNTIRVSHKFGESGKIEGNTLVSLELHDCGIVYHPDRPYFLCVMTQGKELTDLEGIIASISRLIYEKISNGDI